MPLPILLLSIGCSWFEPPPPVTVEARWEGQPTDNPRYLSVDIHTNQDVCVYDQHIIEPSRSPPGVYRVSDRIIQADYIREDTDTWGDSEPGLLLQLTITSANSSVLSSFDHLFPATRCVPAGTDIHRKIPVPTPVAYWDPYSNSSSTPLHTHPKYAVVMVGYALQPQPYKTIDTPLEDGTLIQRVSPEHWTGPVYQSIARSAPLSMEGMEYLRD